MKYSKMIIVMLILIGCLVLVGVALTANGFIFERTVFGGGGQEATGGDFILNGTIGEPIASGLNVGPEQGMSSGFWWIRNYRAYLPLILNE